MTKEQFISAIAKKSGMPKTQVQEVISAFTETVTEVLVDGDKINLIGFGTFETRQRAAREGHNPATGEKLKIPACTYPAFKPSKILKEAVDKG